MNSPDPASGSNPGGKVEISDYAPVTVIHGPVLACHGVVDRTPGSFRSASGKRLGVDSAERGGGIDIADDALKFDLPVADRVGTNDMQTVRFPVEEMRDTRVARVNFYVDGPYAGDVFGRIA